MKALFFCPTPFEVPGKFRKQTKVFGMGEKKARTLARELNASLKDDSRPIVLYGCAGALDFSVKNGDVFEITEILSERHQFQIPAKTKLKSIRLWTSPHIVHDRERENIRSKSGAHLVDMEMGFFYDELSPQIRSRVIFLRGVLDEVEADMSFFKPDGGIKISIVFSPSQIKGIFKLLLSLKKYRSSIGKTLETLEFN